jgi:hypothetical protein
MAQAEHRVSAAEAEAPVDIWAQNRSRYPGFTDSKLFSEFLHRLVSNRDMHVIITAAAETGVGKTTLAFALALLWDMSGWTTEKATLSPREYEQMYDEVAPGSVLMLDEVQQAADNRRATSSDNVELSQAFATKRYRQVFGMMTAPSKAWVDGRIGADSADYWIQCQETPDGRPKGEAKVYRLKNNEHYGESYHTRCETIAWPILDWHPEFRKLERLKAERMEGQSEDKYVHRDEVRNLKQNYWDKCSRKSRFHLVRAMSEFGIAQTDIAKILDFAEADSGGDIDAVGQSRVSHLINADSFDEVYSS